MWLTNSYMFQHIVIIAHKGECNRCANQATAYWEFQALLRFIHSRSISILYEIEGKVLAQLVAKVKICSKNVIHNKLHITTLAPPKIATPPWPKLGRKFLTLYICVQFRLLKNTNTMKSNTPPKRVKVRLEIVFVLQKISDEEFELVWLSVFVISIFLIVKHYNILLC